MSKHQRILWFELVIVGSKWQVYLASPNDREMTDLDGCCLASKNIILIDWTLSPDQLKATLFHEMLHAIFTMSGFDHAVSDILGKTPEEWADTEEILVRLLGPQIVDTLERNGWNIALPTLPTNMPVVKKRKKEPV